MQSQTRLNKLQLVLKEPQLKALWISDEVVVWCWAKLALLQCEQRAETRNNLQYRWFNYRAIRKYCNNLLMFTVLVKCRGVMSVLCWNVKTSDTFKSWLRPVKFGLYFFHSFFFFFYQLWCILLKHFKMDFLVFIIMPLNTKTWRWEGIVGFTGGAQSFNMINVVKAVVPIRKWAYLIVSFPFFSSQLHLKEKIKYSLQIMNRHRPKFSLAGVIFFLMLPVKWKKPRRQGKSVSPCVNNIRRKKLLFTHWYDLFFSCCFSVLKKKKINQKKNPNQSSSISCLV